jgi:hypothetical protein
VTAPVLSSRDVFNPVFVAPGSFHPAETVAIGLRHIRDSEWAGEIPERRNTVTVSVQSVPVEHTVQMDEFTKWLERTGGSPSRVSGASASGKFSEHNRR